MGLESWTSPLETLGEASSAIQGSWLRRKSIYYFHKKNKKIKNH